MHKGKTFITGCHKDNNNDPSQEKQEQSTAIKLEPEQEEAENDVIRQPVIKEMAWEEFLGMLNGIAILDLKILSVHHVSGISDRS